MIDWSAPYTADPSLVAKLKAIDPAVELLYLAEGTWALVSRPDPNTVKDGLARRKLTGRNILRAIRKAQGDPVTERAAMLIAEGYGIVALHAWEYAPTHDLVEWFAEADYLAKTRFAEEYDKKEAVTDGRAWEEHMTTTLRDYQATEGRAAYDYAFRGRRHILQRH